MKEFAILPSISFAKTSLLFSCLLFFFSACNNDQKQVEALANETESVHDDAMKDMADMNRVARELKQTLIAATMTPEQSAIYTQTLEAIGKAENDMMDWMKNYKRPEGMAAPEALKYLQEQKALIEKNHAEIKAALEAGMKLQGK